MQVRPLYLYNAATMKNLIWSSSFHSITTDKGENMKNIKAVCIVFLFIFSGYHSFVVEIPSLRDCLQDNDESGQHSGMLEVFVLASKGKELPDAHVFINNTYKGKTDSEGKLIIKGLPAQEYTIRVEAEGYSSKEKTVTVEQGTTTVVVFEMGTTFVDLDFFETAFGIGVLILVLVGIPILFYFTLKLFITLKKKKGRTVKNRILKKPPVSYCPLCNAKIQEDWTVCPHCGATLTGAPDDKTQVY